MRLHKDIVALLRNPETPNYAIIDRLQDLHYGEHAVASVYVVVGTSGEYSDESTWTVAAFLNKEGADELCTTLNRWCEENNCTEEGPYPADDIYVGDRKPPDDPNFDYCAPGVQYRVGEVPLRA